MEKMTEKTLSPVKGHSAAPLLSDLREVVKEGRTYQVALKSLIATGEAFVVAEFPLVYEDIN